MQVHSKLKLSAFIIIPYSLSPWCVTWKSWHCIHLQPLMFQSVQLGTTLLNKLVLYSSQWVNSGCFFFLLFRKKVQLAPCLEPPAKMLCFKCLGIRMLFTWKKWRSEDRFKPRLRHYQNWGVSSPSDDQDQQCYNQQDATTHMSCRTKASCCSLWEVSH